EGADIRDDKGDAKLILRANLPEVNAAVFNGQAAAVAVVTELHDLVLQCFVLEVVTDASDEVEAFARFATVTYQRPDLARGRLQERDESGRPGNRQITRSGIVIQPEERGSDKEFPVRLDF